MSFNPKIQIGIPCGRNSSKLLELCVFSFVKTCSNIMDLEFIFGINDPDFDRTLLDKFKDKINYQWMEISCDLEYSSMRHGMILDVLLDKMTAEFGFMVDCDIVCLFKHWDTIFPRLLEGTNVILGATYNRNSLLPKYQKFPNASACLFRTQILKDAQISFKPSGHPQIRSTKLGKEEAHLFCRDAGEKIYLDTGYELPLKLKKLGYTGIPFDFSNPRHFHHGNEFYFHNQLCFSHLKGITTKDGFEDGITIGQWSQQVAEYLAKDDK